MRNFSIIFILLISFNLNNSAPSSENSTPISIDEAIKNQVEALVAKCKDTNNITPNEAKIAASLDVPKTENERCFLQCIYEDLGIVQDGKFSAAQSKTLAQMRFGKNPEDLNKAFTLIDNCARDIELDSKTTISNEKCKLGGVVRECLVKYNSQLNFFPK